MSDSNRPRWTVFCAMVDNFGDIGVCWRLSRQLVHEHGIAVELWVDDWPALQRFIAAQPPEPDICLQHWCSPWTQTRSVTAAIADSDVVIEAFGCELPVEVKAAMASSAQPPRWINLEYLSAEDWVAGCHGLPSPQNLSPAIRKFFFFPGFDVGTGGLLREASVLDRHMQWQQHQTAERQRWWQMLGVDSSALPLDVLMVSIFSYENPALPGLLQALAAADEPVVCVIPEGRSLNSLHDSLAGFQGQRLHAGDVLRLGSLTLVVTAFSSQDDYDHLLSLCDFNLVRGEDSFVRAQWAGKPMLWHIYPQHDGVHLGKLHAFMARYLEGLEPELRLRWELLAQRWNLGEDCRELWHYLRPQLPDLQQHARKWQKKLAEQPDLATNLVRFVNRPPAGLTT